MAKRLNDTEALTARPYEPGENHSICTRRIDNGYVTDVSTYNPNTGDYRCAQVYTKNPPRITPPKIDGRQGGPAPDGPNTMQEAKAYLGGLGQLNKSGSGGY